ncbi:hypothetical protein M3P05_09560 [Sansalvadorimonas sp. 2012CJ34-2]|uniref:Uncharacterized protein n=1 Tax=Parendozoicomonas callyspongiae TaxID=2942213 RepID=A0ABT0PFN2_9GAMM|nr:hypothetical protein [Sansalvadorimonas sp. 2012CJ34-2]MCL6270179.1 hypothetical protein [Sansalvadorimonas sp. 2012CJ34-2]
MPVSTTMNRKKTKSRSVILCDQMDELIAKSKKELNVFSKIKEELDFEPGLLKKAVSMKLGSEEDVQQVVDDMKQWKNEVKNEVKTAVMSKRKDIRAERKARRQDPWTKTPTTKTTARKKKKSRGGFI